MTKLLIIFISITTMMNIVNGLSLVENQNRLSHLHPDIALENEQMEFGTIVFYDLLELEPSSHYEVRISYPATTPTSFDIKFVDGSPQAPTRHLSNTEKLMFKTDDQNNIVGQKPLFPNNNQQQEGKQYYRIQVTATDAGVRNPQQTSQENSTIVTFNIVLETLFFGIPYDALTLVGVILVALMLIFCLFIPQLMPMVVVMRKQKTH